MERRQKLIVTLFVVVIVLVVLIGVVPMVVRAIIGPGSRVEGLDTSHAKPASTEVDGSWTLTKNHGPNRSAIGFTFDEVLPGDQRTTSGQTNAVDGAVTITDQHVVEGTASVDMQQVATDNGKRDNNVRTKIFETDTYPTAEFTLSDPVDVSEVPDDGTPGTVTLAGTLTIHGETQQVKAPFQVLRDGDYLVISGDIRINRNDFGVESPDFVAAVIADEGDINVTLVFEKD